MPDNVEDPPHYTRLKPEPRDVIIAWDLTYCAGSAVKYIARAGHKGPIIEDYEKSINFLKAEIKRLRSAPGGDD